MFPAAPPSRVSGSDGSRRGPRSAAPTDPDRRSFRAALEHGFPFLCVCVFFSGSPPFGGSFRYCNVSFEQHPRLKLPRFIAVGLKDKPADADVAAALAFTKQIVNKGKPMSILWDLSQVTCKNK